MRRKPGRLGMTLFFGVFLGMGLLFVASLLRDWWQAVGTYSWRETPARILASDVVTVNDGYRFTVQYQYGWDGRDYTNDVYRHSYAGSDNYDDAQALARRYPAGQTTVCWVNPREPATAVLGRRSLWFGLTVFLPLIFVAVGAGGIWHAWRRLQPADELPPPVTKGAVNARRLAWVAPAFCLLFLAVGLGMAWPLSIRPLANLLSARHWVATPCVILSSRVKAVEGDESTTYRVDILYEYEFGGQRYRSDRHEFLRVSSSGYAGKEAIVQGYPVGATRTCYVNPANPTEAVLQRGWRSNYWFTLFPFVFVAFGGFGFWASLRAARQAASPVPTRLTGAQPVRAKGTRPLVNALGLLLVALFWNGILSLFVWQAMKGWQRGQPDWFLTLFLIPFVVIGLGLGGGVFYYLMAAFNPRLRVTLSGGPVAPGGMVDLRWDWTGRSEVIQELRWHLELREEATDTSGDSSSTKKKVVTTVPVLTTVRRGEIAAGRAKVRMPPDAAHTFRAVHNKLQWWLVARGVIPWWPDVTEEFEVEVLPGPSRPVSAGTGTSATAAGLTVELARTAYAPGEELTGRVWWELAKPVTAVEARLCWLTRGAGTTDVAVVDQQRWERPAAQDAREIRFRLPDAPRSYAGELVTVAWAVEVVTEPECGSARCEFWLG